MTGDTGTRGMPPRLAPPPPPRPQGITMPAYMSQVRAAEYLGVSVRYFRDHVEIEPVPFPGSGNKPVERYARVDLDAWAEKWRTPKARRTG